DCAAGDLYGFGTACDGFVSSKPSPCRVLCRRARADSTRPCLDSVSRKEKIGSSATSRRGRFDSLCRNSRLGGRAWLESARSQVCRRGASIQWCAVKQTECENQQSTTSEKRQIG